MLVGLISDTHGLLRTEVLTLLRGSELIIHAGDVGGPEILPALASIAPVVAVRGNIDKRPPMSLLPFDAAVQAGGLSFYVLHNIADLDLDPAISAFDVIVSGHSHKRESYVKAGVVYINPGSAGPRRFRLPVSVALLNTETDPLRAEFLDVEP